MAEELQAIISEFKTLSPDLTSVVVFKLKGEALATSEGTTPEQTQVLIAGLNRLAHTGCVGGFQRLSIQDVNSQVSVASIGDVCLATASSRVGDQKVIKSLTQIVAPTVIQLALKMPHVSMETPKNNHDKIMQQIEAALPIKPQTEVPTPQGQETSAEMLTPKLPSAQFIVEKIGGLLVASDCVRIDIKVLSDWQEHCGRQFSLVHIETLEGKTFTCKFRPQKDGKGTIGIPDKILQALGCEKGKLVMVKPVTE